MARVVGTADRNCRADNRALLLVVPVFAAADITGKWSGSFQITRPNGTLSDDKIVMSLAQKDTEVTGTIGPPPICNVPFGTAR